jgi:hypothetical protein
MAAHQRGDLGTDRELAAGGGFDQADALDAAHRRGLGPLASAHVQFGVVEAERLDFDDDLTGQRLGLRQVLVDQAIRSTESLDDNGTHHDAPEVDPS